MAASGPTNLTWQRGRDDAHTSTLCWNLQLEESSSGERLPLVKSTTSASNVRISSLQNIEKICIGLTAVRGKLTAVKTKSGRSKTCPMQSDSRKLRSQLFFQVKIEDVLVACDNASLQVRSFLVRIFGGDGVLGL